MGHSPTTALKHYAKALRETFEHAAKNQTIFSKTASDSRRANNGATPAEMVYRQQVTQNHPETCVKIQNTANAGENTTKSQLESGIYGVVHQKERRANDGAEHAGIGRNSVQTFLHQQSQVPKKTAPCISVQEADSVQNSPSRT